MTAEIFKGTAWYYARYREPYPAPLFELIRTRFGLNGRGRMLDIGTGTGQLAIALARDFEEVVALDVSREMIDQARLDAKRSGVDNVDLRVMSGGAISSDLGSFRLATFGQSLHWMDPDQTLRSVRALTDSGGGVAILGARSIWGGTAPWEVAAIETVKRWLGEPRRAGSGTFRVPERPFEDLLQDAGYVGTEMHHFLQRSTWNFEYVIGHLYSTSYCNRELLRDRVPEFEKDLEKSLLAVDPSGRFEWNVDVNCLLGFVT
ncbi:MAG: methyltransferase domain-containing protein [Chloroflexi bacterium]|nr:methyltransferase domain-containing protein [Chloroflexota bacterium]